MAITKYKTDSTPCKTYKALLTQAGVYSGTDISLFDGEFIIGETYTIIDYVVGDDFSNIANVISATAINGTGCEFIATGRFPEYWGEGSSVVSNGGLFVEELENSLGFEIQWFQNDWGDYIGVSPTPEPFLDNAFPSNKTYISNQGGYQYGTITAKVGTLGLLAPAPIGLLGDDIIYLNVRDFDGYPADDILRKFPISIEIYP
jgi:hypothetical protein